MSTEDAEAVGEGVAEDEEVFADEEIENDMLEENFDSDQAVVTEQTSVSHAASKAESGDAEINTTSLDELNVAPSWVTDAQSSWKQLVSQSASKEACADAIYGAIFNASTTTQYLFTSPRVIAAGKFFFGLNAFCMGMDDPPTLMAAVENLAFGHLALDVTLPRLVIVRDAILDLYAVELGAKFTTAGYNGWKALLNYVGGAIIYIKAFYNERIKLLNSSWAMANDKDSNKDKFATMGSTDKPITDDRDAAKHENETSNHGARSDSVVQNVPTTFREMYQFNAAVMGFGQNLWMNEVLACFDNIVANCASPGRLTEECDVLVCRIAKVTTGKVNLSDFKSGMLASLRSLLPKDWTTDHEVAWTWLWGLVERTATPNLGLPVKWERAYGLFLDGVDEATGYKLRSDIFSKFFAVAPSGQDYFKQSNTYLHLVSTKVLLMILDMYRDPVKMVDDISSVGLRHVGYGAPTQFFPPFTSAIVEVISTYTDDETCIEGFKWSAGLIAKSTVRTIIEGSTIVMQAINVNSRKAMSKALSVATRGERSDWMLMIQVGSQNISPLAWAIASGALDAASTMLRDLLTIRADRDRYYYPFNDLFNRHADVVSVLLTDAPSLFPELMDGLIWRSRMTQGGQRRVNYYIKHLMVDGEGKFARNLEWVLKAQDPKIVCHPVLVTLSDLVWSGVACNSFLFRKSWFVFILGVFICSQSVLQHIGNDDSSAKRFVIFGFRCFVYIFGLGNMVYHHSTHIFSAYRHMELIKIRGVFPVPSYLATLYETTNILLMCILLVMLGTEPILHCIGKTDELLTGNCSDAYDIKVVYSVLSLVAMLLYFFHCIDLAVFNNRVSAYVLVCGRMLVEMGVFLFALVIVILTFSSGMSCLEQEHPEFIGLHNGSLALWEMAVQLFNPKAYLRLKSEMFLIGVTYVFMIVSVVFLLNLLVAQLTCAYDAIYADMVGYARITRIKIIVESMPQVSPKKWSRFVGSLEFEKRIDFNAGDVGVSNGYATTEPANAHPTTVDAIKRFGGSTSPEIQWPEESAGDDESDRFERLETLIKRAMDRVNTTGTGKKKAGVGDSSAGHTSSAGEGGAGSEGGHEEEAEQDEA